MNSRKNHQSDTLPVRPGMHIDVSIHDISHRGEGVGRYDGLATFIPGGVPGDRLIARVTQVKKGYARAALVRVVEPSPHRVSPRCPVFGKCGGCQLQHMSYETQLALKRQQVVDAVTRMGKLENIPVHPTIGMADPWHYRNNVQFPIGQRAGKVIAGFFIPRSHQIVDIKSCHIVHPFANDVLRRVKELTNRYDVPIYDPRAHRGVLRHVIVRTARGNDQAIAVLVTRTSKLPHGRAVAETLMERMPPLVGVVQNIQGKRTGAVLGPTSKVLAGIGHLTDDIGPFTFKISPESFFQVNPIQTEVLYEQVMSYAALTPAHTAIDLYSGVGTISLFLAQKARRVIGIERVEKAVNNAEFNARKNGVNNVRYITGDVSESLPQLAAAGTTGDVIVLDPPRAGCDRSVLKAVADMGPKRIVYVSCNPASLARDLARFKSLGYKTVEVQPIDMFPHTAHVECCTLLVKNESR